MTRKHSQSELAEAMRGTMDLTGWGAAADLIVDMTAERLAAEQGEVTDEALEYLRHRLWPVWNHEFAIMGPC